MANFHSNLTHFHWMTLYFGHFTIKKRPNFFLIPHLMTPFFYEIMYWIPCFCSPVGTYPSLSYLSAPPRLQLQRTQLTSILQINCKWSSLLVYRDMPACFNILQFQKAGAGLTRCTHDSHDYRIKPISWGWAWITGWVVCGQQWYLFLTMLSFLAYYW